MVITSFDQAISYISQFIPSGSVEDFPGDWWYNRAKEFVNLLGNPQEQLKIIHIAGTSGKGSTAYLTSILLKSQGFRVGLNTSPHIIHPLERIQINNEYVSEQKFIKALNRITSAIEEMKKTKYGAPSYFEIFTALAFTIFSEEKVDYAVIETGIGGIYDASNVVKRSDKIAVITNIGFDHIKILGNSLTKIASAKAGIIQKGNTVISAKQFLTAQKVIEKKVKDQDSQLLSCPTDFGYKNIRIDEKGTEFDFWIRSRHPIFVRHPGKWAAAPASRISSNDMQIDSGVVPNGLPRMTKFIKFNKLKLGLIGKHQVENCSVALAVLYEVAKRENFEINENNLRSSLQTARFVGRFDIVHFSGHPELLPEAAASLQAGVSGSNKKEMFDPSADGQHDNIVILDGAHNPQKMAAFIKTLKKVFPSEKFTFLLTFINTKDYKNILKYIVPIASEIVITNLVVTDKDWQHASHETSALVKAIEEFNFKNYKSITDPKEAIEYCLRYSKNKIVVTGSLYLLSEIYTVL